MQRRGFKQVLSMTFQASRLACSGLLLIKVLSSVAQSILILVLAEFLNSVLGVFDAGAKSSIHILIIIMTYVILQLFVWLEPNISDLFNTQLLVKMRKYCSDIVLNKYARLQYRHIEDEQTLNLLERVTVNTDVRLVECYHSFLSILGFILKMAGLAIVLFSQAVLPAIAIIACAAPLLFLAIKSGRASYEAAKEVTNRERKAGYLSELMLERDYVYERKLFGYGEHINRMWKDDFEFARKLKQRTSIKWYLKSKAGSVLTAMIAVIASLALIEPVLSKSMSVGLYISLVGSIYTLVKVMAWEFMQSVDSLASTHEYIKDFNAFCALEEEQTETEAVSLDLKFESLQFDHVFFKYPNTDNYVLNDLCIRIDKHKKYSIVGVNGAGKTTMMKLIFGLYQGYEGTILLNGKNISEYSKTQVRSICAVVFQDFAKYSLSIRDNILIGGLATTAEIAQKEIDQVTQYVGLKDAIDKYELGLDTRLGSNFQDGQDFSGGQWQRLAIARNLIGNSELTFFDEPTALLDPIAENRFYQSLQSISMKKAIVIVSHRLAVAKSADYIYVIDNGTVSEAGSFEQLMRAGQGFAQMYESQRGWYDEAK